MMFKPGDVVECIHTGMALERSATAEYHGIHPWMASLPPGTSMIVEGHLHHDEEAIMVSCSHFRRSSFTYRSEDLVLHSISLENE